MAGKTYREGISYPDLMRKFPDDATAEKWFIEQRWPDSVCCPKCGSNNVQARKSRKPQPYRCRSCRKDFSVKTGTLMHNSPLGYQVWAIAIYLSSTNLKGISSMKLHRDLGITQKSAWHLMHRIRETWKDQQVSFAGPIEVDETYIGGKERNKPFSKRNLKHQGRLGKSIVVGAKDRPTNQVSVEKVPDTKKKTLHKFVNERLVMGGTVYTDDNPSYNKVRRRHKAVKHSVSQYVNGMAHTNGIESFWALLKRGYHGTYHHMSERHLERYIQEFAGRFNIRELDTILQMALVAKRMEGKQLTYEELIQSGSESNQ